VRPQQLQDLLAAAGRSTDVLVLAHGWNNDMADARALYALLRDRLEAQLPSVGGAAGRSFTLAGFLWPSKKFADKDLIPGGAAAAGGGALDDVLRMQIDTLEAAAGDEGDPQDFARLRAIAPDLEDVDDDTRAEFATRVLKYLPDDAAEEDGDAAVPPVLKRGEVGGLPLLEALGRPVVAPPSDDELGGATSIDDDAIPPASAGGAAGLGDLFGGVKAGAMNLLNATTYYKMKGRAGDVGRRGAYEALRALRALPNQPRIHLVGHSFGARLVSAAALGPDGQPPVPVASITLLQGAFSHYGFAQRFNGGDSDGFFRRVLTEGRLAGPLLVTHTRNDKAVGIAYAVASRVMRQQGAALGDEHDKYGGMGSNGAQDTPERVAGALHAPGDPYTFLPGKVYNLRGDEFISGHSDVASDATAYAILSAVAST
jgi:hypothetical protein